MIEPMEHWQTPDLWKILIDAWRATPSSPKTVQATTGLSYLQVMNAMKVGWPKAEFSAPPIESILKMEQETLRAAASMRSNPKIEASFAAAEQKRRLAKLTLEDEEKISSDMRHLAVGVSSAFVELLPAIGLLARELRNQIEAEEEMTSKERMAILRSAIKLISDGTHVCKQVFELERLRIGKPTSVATQTDDLSYEEAVTELSGLQRTLERAKNLPITH